MARPCLLVPGSVEMLPIGVGSRHELEIGELAGYRLGEDITNWKNTYTFVALDDLSLDERRRFAPHLAEEWSAIAAVDAGASGYRGGDARRPHLARLLRRARLLLVGSTDGRDLGPAAHVDLAGPRRVLEVGFQRNADDYFHLHLRRGALTLASIGGALHSILDNISAEGGAWPAIETRDRTLDRVIREATSGLADAAHISLAFWMADIADVDGWEAHLAAIAARAAAHETLADEVTRRLREAPEDTEVIDLPSYGEARRTRLPPCELRSASEGGDLAAHVDVAGRSVLALPAESVWTVAEVDPDPLPAPPPRIFRGATPRVARDPRRAIALIILVVLLLLAGLIALARRGGRIGDACTSRRDCRSRMCLRFAPSPGAAPSGEGMCTRACSADADCGAGFACRPLPFEGVSVCQRATANERERRSR